MTSSSIGFIGLTTARYFPNDTIALPPLSTDISGTGFNVVIKYQLYFGAGSSSSTFYAPYINTSLQATIITLDNVCDVLNNLNLLMGLINVQINLNATQQQNTTTPSLQINFQYKYQSEIIKAQATVDSQCALSTKVILPIPIILGDVCTTQGLATFNLPCYVILQTTPQSLYNSLNTQATSDSINLSAYLVADMNCFPEIFSTLHYSLSISDVNSTLTTPFKFNRAIFSSIVSECNKPKTNITIIGGFTAVLQYTTINLPAGTSTVASSVNNTLGSIILQNATV